MLSLLSAFRLSVPTRTADRAASERSWLAPATQSDEVVPPLNLKENLALVVGLTELVPDRPPHEELSPAEPDGSVSFPVCSFSITRAPPRA